MTTPTQAAIEAAKRMAKSTQPHPFLTECVQDAIDTETAKLRAEVKQLKRKCLDWALGVEQSNTDIVDMQRDEFRRIIALTENSEIKGICERAIAIIEQTVPVIIQRDDALAKLAKAEACCAALSAFADVVSEACQHPTATSDARMLLIRGAGKRFLPAWKLNRHDCGRDYIRKSDADAATREAVKPLVEALKTIRENCQHIVAGNLVDSQLGSIARDALAHARSKGW